MKTQYTEWHKMFPGSGQGKQYPYLLDNIIQNKNHNRYYSQKQRGGSPKLDPLYRTAVDYGCGKGGTIRWLNGLAPHLQITGYDPGNPDYRDVELTQYDLAYSCDVFEHIEREDIPHTIHTMQSLAPVNILIIDLTPAKKHLPDGRNAHVTLLSKDEWIDLIEQESRTHHTDNIQTYSQPDPNFGERTRLCVTTTSRTRAPS